MSDTLFAFVGSDDHPELKRAIAEVLSEAYWQRCYVHFLRDALDYLPRKGGDDCLVELHWLYGRRDAAEARRDLMAWLLRWQEKYPKLCTWVEENIGETFTFYRLPQEHHKHLQGTNMLERINQELKRRTHVFASFLIRKVLCAWSERSPWKSTKTGLRPTAI